MDKFLEKFGVIQQKRLKSAIAAETEPAVSEAMTVSADFMDVLQASYRTFNFKPLKSGKLARKEEKIHNSIEKKVLKAYNKIKDKLAEIEFDNIIALALALSHIGQLYVTLDQAYYAQSQKGKHDECNLLEAENFFSKCTELLKGKELEPKVILIIITALIKSSYVSAAQHKLDAYLLLQTALNLYEKYTEENEYPAPIDVMTLLGIEERPKAHTKILLDNLFVETLQNLTKLYYYKTIDKHEYVKYMHNLLNSQMKDEFLHSNYIEFAGASADLSIYFIQHSRFIEAENHLAVASFMLEKFDKEILISEMATTTIDDRRNQSSKESRLTPALKDLHEFESAKINKLWGIYGVQLLHTSRENLLPDIKNISCETDNSESKNKKSTELLTFSDLKQDLEKFTIGIPDKYIKNRDDAKTLFKKIVKLLERAKKYFFIKDKAIYGEIILYFSKAYKYFARLVRQKNKQTEIYQEQITLLEEESNNYQASINKKEQNLKNLMWLDLAFAYFNFLNVTNEDVEVKDIPPTLKETKDMQETTLIGIKYILTFLECR